MAARAAYRGGGKESITIAMSTMAARAAYRGGGKDLLLYSHANYGS